MSRTAPPARGRTFVILASSGALLAAAWAVALAPAPLSGLAPAAAKSEKRLACVWLNNPAAFTAFSAAYGTFLENWLVIGEDWFQAYEIGGSAPHPLLPRPRDEDMGSVKGYVWARDVRCEISQAPIPTAKEGTVDELWRARLVARSVTFSEEGNDWTPPLEDGVLWEIFLARSGETWVADDNSVDASILSMGAKERRPAPTELPARKTPRKWQ